MGFRARDPRFNGSLKGKGETREWRPARRWLPDLDSKWNGRGRRKARGMERTKLI